VLPVFNSKLCVKSMTEVVVYLLYELKRKNAGNMVTLNNILSCFKFSSFVICTAPEPNSISISYFLLLKLRLFFVELVCDIVKRLDVIN
jgi:hypothetical protein